MKERSRGDSRRCTDRSKAQLQSELEIPGAEGPAGFSELRAIQTIVAGGPDVRRSQLKVGVIEDIKCLRAKLQPEAVGEPKGLEQRCIQV